MIITLLKKQMLSFVAPFTQSKEGKPRSTGSTVGFVTIMLILFVGMGMLFYGMADMLCAPLVAGGLSWLYFSFMGTMATALGAVISLFMAKTSLYEAKDNDLLFSMPIPSWMILFTRMAGLYLLTLLFETFVFLPALVCYFVAVGFSFTVLVFGVIVLLIMPFGALALCSVLGWLLALFSAKLPLKNLFTVILCLAVMVGYVLLESKLNEYLGYVVANGGVVAEKMQTILFPFWKMGLACVGEWAGLGWYLLIFGGAFALVYLLLAKTYLSLVTANRGGKKTKYVSKEGKQGHPFLALLKKEIMRFTKNPMVALNCFLGTLFLVAFPFGALFMGDLTEALLAANADGLAALVLSAIVCGLIALNIISAASVSLEGESIWIARSLPLPTKKILLAKAAFHFLATALPTLFAAVFFGVLYRMGGHTILVALVGIAFSAYGGLFGLLINLKLPNLHWENELVAVKQGFSPLLSMLAELGVTALLIGGYFLFGKYLHAAVYLAICIAFLVAASGVLLGWICRRGTKIFENL